MDTRYLKNVSIAVLSAVIAIVFIFYIGYHLWGGEASFSTLSAPPGKVSEEVPLEAYLFRDETLVYASGGTPYFLAQDGTSVRAGEALANVYSGDEADLSAVLSAENRLSVLRESNLAGSTGSTAGIDSKIHTIVSGILEDTASGRLGYAEQNRNALLVQINRRKIAVRTVTGYHAAIAACEEERTSLMNSYSLSLLQTVTSPITGNFYSGADGYENLFSASAAEEIRYDDFISLLTAPPDESLLQNEAGAAIGAVTQSSHWSIGFLLENRYLRQIREGRDYEVIFPYNGSLSIQMTVERIVSRFGEDRALVFMGTREHPEGFRFARVQDARLVVGSFEGLKLPVGCVRYVGGKTGVYILKGNEVEFRRVEILYETNGSFIVRGEPPEDTSREEESSGQAVEQPVVAGPPKTQTGAAGPPTPPPTPSGSGESWISTYDQVILDGKNLHEGEYAS